MWPQRETCKKTVEKKTICALQKSSFCTIMAAGVKFKTQLSRPERGIHQAVVQRLGVRKAVSLTTRVDLTLGSPDVSPCHARVWTNGKIEAGIWCERSLWTGGRRMGRLLTETWSVIRVSAAAVLCWRCTTSKEPHVHIPAFNSSFSNPKFKNWPKTNFTY